MSLFDICDRFGPAALLRFLALLLAFLTLATLRTPLQIAVRVLTALMHAVDNTVSARLAAGPIPPRQRPAWAKGATA